MARPVVDEFFGTRIALITEAEFLAVLGRRIARSASMVRWSRLRGLTPQHVCMVRKRKRPIGHRIAAIVGYRPVFFAKKDGRLFSHDELRAVLAEYRGRSYPLKRFRNPAPAHAFERFLRGEEPSCLTITRFGYEVVTMFRPIR